MRLILLALAVLAIPASLVAQNADKPFRYNELGYTYFSAGACQHGYFNLGVGGGGERFIWRGLTLGGELGYYTFPADRNGGYGVITINPGYHFVNRKIAKKLDPYISATLAGLAFNGGGSAGAGYLGGGVNYWFRERAGLQIGAQIQVVGSEALILFRAGVTFR